MVTTTRRQRILEAIKARLEDIAIQREYQTDLGKNVQMGEVIASGPDDAYQILAILPREDQVAAQVGGKNAIVLPVDIAVLVSPTVRDPWIKVEQALADVKKAMELEDRSLGGLLIGGNNNAEGLVRGTTTPFERQSGSDPVGASITYGCRYPESWGRPDL